MNKFLLTVIICSIVSMGLNAGTDSLDFIRENSLAPAGVLRLGLFMDPRFLGSESVEKNDFLGFLSETSSSKKNTLKEVTDSDTALLGTPAKFNLINDAGVAELLRKDQLKREYSRFQELDKKLDSESISKISSCELSEWNLLESRVSGLGDLSFLQPSEDQNTLVKGSRLGSKVPGIRQTPKESPKESPGSGAAASGAAESITPEIATGRLWDLVLKNTVSKEDVEEFQRLVKTPGINLNQPSPASAKSMAEHTLLQAIVIHTLLTNEHVDMARALLEIPAVDPNVPYPASAGFWAGFNPLQVITMTTLLDETHVALAGLLLETGRVDPNVPYPASAEVWAGFNPLQVIAVYHELTENRLTLVKHLLDLESADPNLPFPGTVAVENGRTIREYIVKKGSPTDRDALIRLLDAKERRQQQREKNDGGPGSGAAASGPEHPNSATSAAAAAAAASGREQSNSAISAVVEEAPSLPSEIIPVFKYYDDGSIYAGQLRNGEPHGTGGMTFANGDWYVGNWQNGKPHGTGRLSESDSFIVYYGEWKDGKPIGPLRRRP